MHCRGTVPIGPVSGSRDSPPAADRVLGPGRDRGPVHTRGVEKVYENLIREGTSDLQEALLNVGLLSRVWPQLRLPATQTVPRLVGGTLPRVGRLAMPSWDFQRTVAAVILDVTQEDGFALAGSGAIREHGLTDRPFRGLRCCTYVARLGPLGRV